MGTLKMKELMDNSTINNSTINNTFNMVAGSSVTLTMVIQGSQCPEAQRLSRLEKDRIATMIEETAALSRRVYRDQAAVEQQLEAIAARLHLL